MSADLVSLKNNILRDSDRNIIKSKILSRIHNLNLDIQRYKTDNEFLLLVCNLTEHLVIKKNKIDKKELVIEIFSELFELNNEEKEILRNSIDFLHNNKAIKKISFYKLFKTGFSEWFRKK